MSMNNDRFGALLERQRRGLTFDTLFAMMVTFGLLVSIAGFSRTTETAPSLAKAQAEQVVLAADWSECEPLAGLAGKRLC